MFDLFYNDLTYTEKAAFHAAHAKRFRGREPSKEWPALTIFMVEFLGQKIKLPIRRDYLWLDWDTALSILGHDIGVKRFYEEKIDSGIDLFIDIGANYGTHTFLFKSAGVWTLSFEPNPSCYEWFYLTCLLNSWYTENWEQVALGSHPGEVALTYPERDTWLGSVCPDVAKRLRSQFDVQAVSVPVRTLDEFIDLPGTRVLIKIDVEGAEGAVLRGAKQFIEKRRPTIVIESWTPAALAGSVRALGGDNYLLEY